MNKSSLDPDAKAFLDAAVITDATQVGAINTLVVDLKANSLWSRLKAVYPMVGGTSFTHKWNLKDPRDLDAAYRLFFINTWTHSANGAKPNAASFAAAETYLNANTMSASSGSLSFYSRENTTTGQDLACADAGSLNYFSLTARAIGNVANAAYGNTTTFCNVASVNSIGFWMNNRNDATYTQLWKNGTKLQQVSAAVTLPNTSLYLAAMKIGGGVNYWSDRQCAYASIGGGFSDAEALTYYNIIQAYQTTLSRQV